MACRRSSWVLVACTIALALGPVATVWPAEEPAPAEGGAGPATGGDAKPAAVGTAATEADKPADEAPAGEVEVLVDEGSVTLIATNVAPKTLVKALSEKAGWQIRMDPEAKKRITLTVTNEPFERVLVTVARAMNYTASRCFVVSPRKEGEELPDRLRLPMDLPSVSLKLTGAAQAAGVIAALKAATHLDIEAAEGLKGQATLQAADTPLPDVLDALCKQLEAVWVLGYRLKPTPPGTGEKTPGALAEPGADAAREQVDAWSKMTPEERQLRARQHTGDLLRADPADRKRQVGEMVTQLRELGRTLAPMTGDDRAKMAQAVQERAGPYLRELQQLPKEQRRDFQPLIQAFTRVLGIAKMPPPGGRQPPKRR